MSAFLKKFGQGLLYLLVLPVFLIAVVVLGIYGVFLFIILMIKSIILFFQGKSLSSDLPEDIEAKRILYPETATPKAIIEEKEPVVVVVKDEEPKIEERRYEEPRKAIESERVVKEIEVKDEDSEEDGEDFLCPLKEEEGNVEEEKEDEEIENDDIENEDEEEDIPVTESESKIKDSVDDFDDDDDDLIFKDWGK